MIKSPAFQSMLTAFHNFLSNMNVNSLCLYPIYKDFICTLTHFTTI